MYLLWVLPVLALAAALIAVFDKSYKDKKFHLSRIGVLAAIVAVLTAGFSIHQNINSSRSGAEQVTRLENINSELTEAEEQRDSLTSQLAAAVHQRDELQKELTAASRNIIFNKDQLADSIKEAKELNAQLETARAQISLLRMQLDLTDERLESVLNQLNLVSLANAELATKVGDIGNHLLQSGIPIDGPSGSIKEVDLQGLKTGILVISSKNCVFQILIARTENSIPVGEKIIQIGEVYKRRFNNPFKIEVNFTRQEPIVSCEVRYTLSGNVSH